MKKTTIELEDGKVYDCGAEELENLKQAIKEEDSKKVVLATVRLLQSSDDMMSGLAKKTSECFKELVDKSSMETLG
jgi:uncharacterized protein (UPF0216 family)